MADEELDAVLNDERGRPIPFNRVMMLREVFRLLMMLTDHERELVLYRFCNSCRRYVGPGDRCDCCRDE
jgi:hypothetical protein